MQDKEGSKAMSIYIVICFLLAGAAGVGYKSGDAGGLPLMD